MPLFITHMLSIWNAAAILLVLSMAVIAVIRWKSLPRQLPVRYDMDGSPITWTGRRGVIGYHLILSLALIVFLAASDGGKMAPVSLFLSAMLLYQMLRSFAIADRRADRLPPWFMPVLTFGVIVLVLLIYLT
jgi:hypothetical protein